MRKLEGIISLICTGLIIFYTKSNAQSTCPQGYQLRNIKCLGSPGLTQICIPSNYACNECWEIEWPKCGSDERSANNNANTYDEAIKTVNQRLKDMPNCSTGKINTDYNRFTISIVSGDYCKVNSSNVQSSSNLPGTLNNLSSGNSSIKPSGVLNSTDNNNNGNPISNTLSQLTTQFYESYKSAISKLDSLKLANTKNAQSLSDIYWPKINYYEQLFFKESNKGNNADPSMLRQYIKELDDMTFTMQNAVPLSNQATDQKKEQLDNQTTIFLNNAQDINQNSISRQMYLDMAKTNAIISGNKPQLQEIQRLQQQQNNEISNNLESILDLIKNKSSNNNPYLSESYKNYINALSAKNIGEKKIYQTAGFINSFFGILYQERIDKQVSEIKQKIILDSLNRQVVAINEKLKFIDFDFKNINTIRYQYLLPDLLLKINTFTPSLKSNSDLIDLCLSYVRSYLVFKQKYVHGINFDEKYKNSIQQSTITQFIKNSNNNKGDNSTLYLIEYYANGINTVVDRQYGPNEKSTRLPKAVTDIIVVNERFRPLIDNLKRNIYDCASYGCTDLENKCKRYDSLWVEYFNAFIGSNQPDSIRPNMEKALSLIGDYLESVTIKNNRVANYQGRFLSIAIYTRFGKFNKDTSMLKKALNDCIIIEDELSLEKKQPSFNLIDKEMNIPMDAIYLACFAKEIEIRRDLIELNNTQANSEVPLVLNAFKKILAENEFDK